MRTVVLVSALLASGCFHWAPIESLGEIQDDRVQVRTADQGAVTLEHATAHGRIIDGIAVDSDPLGPREIDVARSRVYAKRLDALATAGIIAGSAVLTAGTFFLAVLVIVAAARPVFDGGF